MTKIRKGTATELRRLALECIANRGGLAMMVAKNRNQILGQVGHMEWFIREVEDSLAATTVMYEHLRRPK